MWYNKLSSRATDLVPARPLYASPPGCTSNFPTLHLYLLALPCPACPVYPDGGREPRRELRRVHFLHSAAKRQSASPYFSTTSPLFAKTRGVSPKAFSCLVRQRCLLCALCDLCVLRVKS